MQQLAYELLEVVPQATFFAVVLVYLVLCTASLCCGSEWMRSLQRTLTSLSFEILFKDENLKKAKEKVVKAIGHRAAHCDDGDTGPINESEPDWLNALLRPFQIAFSTLPLMLGVMAASVFWQKYIIYETDHNCNPNDLSLECFTNLSGSLSCKAILEQNHSSYVCYKLSLDLTNAAASAGGVFTASIVLNGILVKFFVCVRYTRAGSAGTLVIQLISAGATVAGCVVYGLYVIKDPILEIEKLLQAVAISYRIFFCCLFPWFRIRPSRHEDEYAWIPVFLRLPIPSNDSSDRDSHDSQVHFIADVETDGKTQ